MTVIHRRQFLKFTVLVGTVGFFSKPEASQRREHSVVISQFSYTPHVLEVSAGDAITWKNEDIVPHTATADDLSWDTGEIASGESKTLIVTEGFKSNYYCAYHPMMKASIRLLAGE